MQTSKPFATISYNSEKFLDNKLQELLNTNIIDFYSYIKHIPESDETKAHIHLYIVPSTKTNTNAFLKNFEEKDDKCEKPLACMPAVSSRFADWYMYCLHDSAYLASKGQVREIHYQRSEFKVSNDVFFNDCIYRIDRSKWVGNEKIVSAVESNVPFSTLVRTGQVPVQLIHQYRFMYEILCQREVNRCGRESHTTKNTPRLVNPDTGEIVESLSNNNDLPDLDFYENPFDFEQQGLIED